MISLLIRWIVATWIVMMGIVYGAMALGLTQSVPTMAWDHAVSAVLCLHTGIAIAKRMP